jgi:NADP-dependent 3-hydroxy acid dehydrogenase YdfG
LLDQLREDGGDLINISSVAGRTGRPANGVYAATEWGINGWTESLRQELQPEIRVTMIEPGAVATELTSHIMTIRRRAFLSSRRCRRLSACPGRRDPRTTDRHSPSGKGETWLRQQQ